MIESIAQREALNDGNSMPGYGFGLYKAQGLELAKAVQSAWNCGYRLYDTAGFYRNEEETGRALKPYREADYFLISKIWPTEFGHPVAALDSSLKKLGRDSIDAWLLHWPGTDEKAMLNCYELLLREKEKGKIGSLGVSNFLEPHLERIHAAFNLWPPINQIEIHPWFQQNDVCDFCHEREIRVMAWSPLGRGDELADAVIGEVAAQCGKSPAQVILRWHIQKRHIPIPKSVHPERIAANADVFDFSLSDAQMARINALNKPGVSGRRGADPLVFGG